MKKNFYFMALASMMMLAGMNACKQKLETPPFAASTQTWTIAGRTWSDVIQMPECNHENGLPVMGLPACACRYYYGFKHINYNYRYVLENIEFMCPEPWRLPLTREIIAAKKWLGAYERDTTELWAKGFGNYPTEHSVETFQEGHELWDIETLVFFKTEYDVDNPKFPLLYDFFANQRHLVRCILEQ